ncbi:hypothetical protein StrepF001_17475 [Streptomyces sp. F001]|uniref:hypothetical protein n=1 Tax=Streptomyces sp. F001 TaxID=1510026 RepID=UPI00101E3DC7|nr:hypothetical protein [Streptomyces sp. F001]RZB17635.1 hypothetical protein StrepF001_17475 [Streptomyces sp. F001]
MSDGIVLDHHALLALGRGHRVLSGFIVAAHEDPLYTVIVPALCLAEATRSRPGIATHLAQLPAVEVASIDRIVADTMGRIAASFFPEQGWPILHAAAVSMTTGWEVATLEAKEYHGLGAPLLPVTGA